MRHWKTVHVSEVDETPNALIFKVDELKTTFEIDFTRIKKEVNIKVDQQDTESNKDEDQILSLLQGITSLEEELDEYCKTEIEDHLDNIFV